MAKVLDGTPPVAPAPDRATVVFIRDSGFGFAVNSRSSIIQEGMPGDAVARSHFAIEVPPGSYLSFEQTWQPNLTRKSGLRCLRGSPRAATEAWASLSASEKVVQTLEAATGGPLRDFRRRDRYRLSQR